MNSTKWLGGLLVVQVGLGLFSWWPRDAQGTPPRALVEGGGNTITRVSIVGSAKDSKPVELESRDGQWTLTSADGFPADAEKIGEVLDALGGIKLADPIASQPSSYDQLKVSDTTFDKRVTFTAGGAEHTLVVGAAASKAVYLRVDGGAEVYQAKGLSAWTFKDNTRGFLPANFIDVDKASLVSLTVTNALGTVELIRSGDSWSLGGAAPGAALEDKVSDLLDKATKVRLAETVSAAARPEHGLDTPTVRVSWIVSEGETKTTGGYTVGALLDGKFYVQQDGNPFVVASPSYRIDALVQATAAALSSAPAP